PDAPDPNQPDAFVIIRPDAPVFDARPPDAPRADALPPPIDAPAATSDAPLPSVDAPAGPTVTFSAATLFVGRGRTATIQVVLSQTAGADTPVTLGASGAGATVPTSVIIPMGQTTADVLVSGVTVGDVTLSANPGNAHALVHVVPAVASIDVDVQNILPGGTSTFTVTLESAPSIDVPVVIGADDPSLVAVPVSFKVPMGMTTAQFTATGLELGVTHVFAVIGHEGWMILERVYGVYL